MTRILLALLLLVAGCSNPSSSFVSKTPAYTPETFRDDVCRLISDRRYDDAVAYLDSASPRSQADYDNVGFLAVGEDLIVLPGVYPDVEFDRDRDWEFPGTSDAIEDADWQHASTSFSKRYNEHRAGK